MNITDLAYLGNTRNISSLFERTWESSEGINPVVTAMKIDKYEEWQKDKNFLFFASVLIFSGLAISLVIMAFSSGNGVVLALSFIVAIELLVSLLIITFGYIVKQGRTVEEISKSERRKVEDFCQHLSLFKNWYDCRVPGSTSGSYFYDSAEDYLRNYGSSILVTMATLVMETKEALGNPELSSNEREHWEEKEGDRMAEFTRCYNVLQKINLASGGYTKYFDKAKKQIVESRKHPVST